MASRLRLFGALLAAAALALALGLRSRSPARSGAPIGGEAERALRTLAAYGEVAPCAARLEPSCGEAGPCGFKSIPVERLARLAGQSPKIVPLLSHADARVARRALDLLCHVQDAPANEAIARFAAQRPCVRWVHLALAGAAVDKARLPPDLSRALDDPERLAACQKDDVPGLDAGRPFDYRPPAGYEAWATDGSRALAQRMSRGDEDAFTAAFDALHAMDRARTREALAAMAAVDAPKAWLRLFSLYEAFRDASGAERRGDPNPVDCWEFSKGVGGASLARVAAAQGRSPADALLAIAAEAPDAQVPALVLSVGPAIDPGFVSAAAERRGASRGALAQALARLEYLAQASRGPDPIFPRMNKLFEAGDREGLLAICQNAAQPRATRRTAGYYLAKLGVADGLDAFETPGQPEEIEAGRQALEELSKVADEAVRSRAQQLLPRWKPGVAAPSREEVQRAAESLGGGR